MYNPYMALDEQRKKAYASLLISHSVVTKLIDRRLKEAGVVGIEVYDVLLALEEAPEQRLRMSDIADRIVISRSGITRLADRLAHEGLLERLACPMDRRSIYAVLTPKGMSERERAWPVYRQAIQDYFGRHMTSEEAQVLYQVLGRIVTEEAETITPATCESFKS
jgi:DNA-binding MarR family transcriptional regulator